MMQLAPQSCDLRLIAVCHRILRSRSKPPCLRCVATPAVFWPNYTVLRRQIKNPFAKVAEVVLDCPFRTHSLFIAFSVLGFVSELQSSKEAQA